MAIPRGSTPLHTFTLPVEAESVRTVKITYAQDDTVVLAKKSPDVTVSGNKASVRLTQEDTIRLDQEKRVQIQVRVLTINGDSLPSEIITTTVLCLLDDEVLT